MDDITHDKKSIALTGLFILACFYTVYFSRVILLPIVVAILLNFLLAPLVRYLKKIHIPRPISALLIILIFVSSIAYGFYRLSGPAHDWLAKGPQTIAQVTQKIEILKQPIDKSIKGFFNIQAQIEKSTHISSTKPVTTVAIQQAGLGPFNTIFTSTGEFFIQLGIVIFILYFLLASGEFFLLKTVEILPHLREKKEAVMIAREIKYDITRFLLVKTTTGLGLAFVLSVVLYFLGMPNPILWGVMAGVLEFIPYVGVTIGTLIITIAALLSFDTLNQILLVPMTFFIITSLTGNFVVPLMLSRSLILHPLIIFVAVIFGGWLWGIMGALIAVPMLSILKIFCNNIKSFSALGKFLG